MCESGVVTHIQGAGSYNEFFLQIPSYKRFCAKLTFSRVKIQTLL
jgi:hypothetical protein